MVEIPNSFGVKAFASSLITLQTKDQLSTLPQRLKGTKYLILGGGSNLLLTRDFDGIVVLNQLGGVEVSPQPDDTAIITCGAGENWSGFVDDQVALGWNGLENLSLIPGCVGASPIQNIGAYGVEVCDRISHLEAFNLHSGEFKIFSKEDCQFAYRDSIFKRLEMHQWLITSVSFELAKKLPLVLSYAGLGDAVKTVAAQRGTDDLLAADVATAVKNIRRSKLPDPNVIGNAGSFFKNPIVSLDEAAGLQLNFPNIPSYPVAKLEAGAPSRKKISAGWLIDQCGWKGFRRGDAGVHKDHALVLVNHGGATGQEIWALATEIQSSVFKRFGLHLEPEPIVL
jgi:UDP-N-acetylmuramate dehydrogenase